MPLTLILMRHAKSTWDDPLLSDEERPLNDRGRTAAPLIADWLVENGHLPEKVVTSAAVRTQETWACMAPKMPGDIPAESTPALYLASADTILNVIKTQTAPSLLILCHNPGIADFAERIVKTPPDHKDFRRYPTAATTVITFDAETWQDVTWHSGTATDFTVPRDLAP